MTPWKHCLKVTAAALVSIAVVIHTADCKTAGGEPDEPADLEAGVKLRGERVMVTAEVIEGRLRERYLAKRNGAWVEVATADNDRTFGPVLMVSTEKTPLSGSVVRVALSDGALVEEFAVGEHRVLRNLSLVGEGPWIRVVTRLESSRQMSLSQWSDQLRFSHRADWSYSPSVGGFNPDAQYKAPLILVQAGRVALGLVPDLAVLGREDLKRCNHALDLDVPGGPLLRAGFLPARLASHAVYLLLYQQCWTNPVLDNLTCSAMLLGGFTTQNSDAEWSDARQSQCGNILLDYYRTTGKVEYLERGIAALRAQFPISPSENWAHAGYGGKAGVSSFHWGTGSGLAGIEIEGDFLRDAVVDVATGRGVGVNGLDVGQCSVAEGQIRLHLTTPFTWKDLPVVVFRQTAAARRYTLCVNDVEVGTWHGEDLEKGVALSPAFVASRPP